MEYINGRDTEDTTVPDIDGIINVLSSDVIGNKEDTTATGPVSAVKSVVSYIKQLITGSLVSATKESQFQDEMGMATVGRPVTATLRVSPNGDNTDGSSWSKAYTTIQGALDAASTDTGDCTLILISPNPTYYDINTTGDPTWTGNYILKGSHRNWAKIQNDHASATSVMKFTSRVSIIDLTIDCGSGSNNGLIITGAGSKGARIRNTYFECEHVTGAQTALEISGGTEYAKLQDVMFHGVQAYTRGLLLDNCKYSNFNSMNFHDCLTGLQVTNAASDSNIFQSFEFHTCTIGLDLDAGNGSMFEDLRFFKCTTNVDDEVGDSIWYNIDGNFDITSYPNSVTGITVSANATANLWGADTELRAAVTATKPFRIIGYNFVPVITQNHLIRFSADSGTTWFNEIHVAGTRNQGTSAPSGTEFIFNVGTRISCSIMAESGGSDQVTVWLKLQEI